jgi:phosphate-selective porin OprO/OprP
MNKLRVIPTVLLLLGAGYLASAQETRPSSDKQKIEELEKKVEELDKRVRAAEKAKETKDEAAAKPKSGAIVTASATDGFSIRSTDGDFALRIGGYLQADGRFYPHNDVPATDTFLLRRVRPDFRGTVYKYVEFRLQPEFDQGTAGVADLYLELKYFSRAALRVGKYKPPFGLERLQSATDIWFVERGLTSSLGPIRDVGIQVSGDVVKSRFAYAGGVFNGTPDGVNGDLSTSVGKDYFGRIFLTPWKPNAKHALSGLGVGIAGSTGDQSRAALPILRTAGQNTFFSYVATASTAGNRNRISPQGYYFYGPIGLLGEYARSQQEVRLATGPVVQVTNDAWQVAIAFLVTGEKKSYQGVTPNKNFDPAKKTWGALEVDLRTGQLDADPVAFSSGLASTTTSANHAREWVGGVNWYLNSALKITLDYAHTRFTGGAVNGNRADEKAILSRFQIAF